MKTPGGFFSLFVRALAVTLVFTCAMLTASAAEVPNCYGPPDGLVSWWRAEGNAKDVSEINPGTAYRGATYGPGLLGQAFLFDGTDDHIRVADHPSLRMTNALTIEAWVYPTIIDAARGIVVKWEGILGLNQGGYSFTMTSDGHIYLHVSPTGSSYGTTAVFSTNTLHLNQWAHVAATYDGAALRVFIDGDLDGELAYSGGIYPSTADLAISGLVGGLPPGGVDAPFAGLIDEVAIYNRALTAAELKAIFDAGASGKCAPQAPVFVLEPADQTVAAGEDVTFAAVANGTPPLDYQWLYNDGELSGATQAALVLTNVQAGQAGRYQVKVTNPFGSVLSSNAVLTVTTPCASVPPGLVSWWRAEGNATDSAGTNSGVAYNGASYNAGLVGQAFAFDGADDHIRVSDSPNLRLTNALTIEAWVKPTVINAARGIVVKWEAIPGLNQGGYSFSSTAEGTVYLHVSPDGSSSGTTAAISTNRLQVNQWTHVAGTYDGAALRVYFNGQLDTEVAYSGGIFPSAADLAISGIVGGLSPGGIDAPFAGLIDEVSIYSRALNAAEIKSIYDIGAIGKCGSIVPVITRQPESQMAAVGQDVTFKVDARGTGPLAYQWYFRENEITGATNSQLVLTNIQLSASGEYRVHVSNVAGSVVSSNAVLTVMESCAAIPAGLVSWWRAEGNAGDYRGLNPGTLYRGASYGTGRVGSAFQFDGTDDHVRVADHPTLRLTNALTIEAWVKPTIINATRGIVVKWEAVPGLNQGGYSFGSTGDGLIYLQLSPDGSSYGTTATYSTNRLQLNQWVHVAGTYDGSAIRVYFNGQLESEVAYGQGIYPTPADLAISGIVGGLNPGGIDAPFAGEIDEVAIYNRGLTASEIKSIYDFGAAGKCAAPEAPSIVSQPAGQNIAVGDTATFTVIAAGTAPLAYQWQRDNGTIIHGATDATLILTNAQLGDAGSYSVLVTNSYGVALGSNAFLIVTQPPACTPLADSVVSWWKGDGDTLDQVGGSSGRLAGNASFTYGKVKRSFMFDGQNDAVTLGNPKSLQLQDLTIEAWLKRASATNVSYGSYGNALLFSYGQGGYGFYIDAAGRLALSKIGVNYVTLNSSLTDTDWHHVAVTKSGTTVVFYIDGVAYTVPAYDSGGFVFTSTAAMGARGDNLDNSFFGAIDELTVYARPLSSSEIRAIFDASGGGKCASAVPAFIAVQPSSQNATNGGIAAFSVGAGGTPPFRYQWFAKGIPVERGTNSMLVINPVRMEDAGEYYVAVTNSLGYALSSNAVLTVSYGPALVRVVDTIAGPAGGLATVPVTIVANGNENALGFSLNFDASRLTFVDAAIPSGGLPGQLLVSPSQTGSGRLGLALALSAGETIPAGTQELVRVTFKTAPSAFPHTTPIVFGDIPVLRQISDTKAATLPGKYVGGKLSYPASQFEADLAPRPLGDTSVSIIDWVQAGRYVARLDSPTSASEFQRADCAPRVFKGDGEITVNDWVQAGRYVARIDPLEVAGGPLEPSASEAPRTVAGHDPIRSGAAARYIRVTDGLILENQNGQVSVELLAQGDESALSFSVSFDPAALVFVSAEKGTGVGTATFNVNTLGAAQGKLAFAVALMNKTFAPGLTELVKLTFGAASSASGKSVVTLSDQPAPRGVSDTNALRLSAEYINGTIEVHPAPILSMTATEQMLTLSWPQWATNFVLQEASTPNSGAAGWTTVATPVGETKVTVPLQGNERFYRLKK